MGRRLEAAPTTDAVCSKARRGPGQESGMITSCCRKARTSGGRRTASRLARPRDPVTYGILTLGNFVLTLGCVRLCPHSFPAARRPWLPANTLTPRKLGPLTRSRRIRTSDVGCQTKATRAAMAGARRGQRAIVAAKLATLNVRGGPGCHASGADDRRQLPGRRLRRAHAMRSERPVPPRVESVSNRKRRA
jgi:hypothetical protein